MDWNINKLSDLNNINSLHGNKVKKSISELFKDIDYIKDSNTYKLSNGNIDIKKLSFENILQLKELILFFNKYSTKLECYNFKILKKNFFSFQNLVKESFKPPRINPSDIEQLYIKIKNIMQEYGYTKSSESWNLDILKSYLSKINFDRLSSTYTILSGRKYNGFKEIFKKIFLINNSTYFLETKIFIIEKYLKNQYFNQFGYKDIENGILNFLSKNIDKIVTMANYCIKKKQTKAIFPEIYYLDYLDNSQIENFMTILNSEDFKTKLKGKKLYLEKFIPKINSGEEKWKNLINYIE